MRQLLERLARSKKEDEWALAYRALEREFLNGDDEADRLLGLLMKRRLKPKDLKRWAAREREWRIVNGEADA